MSIAPATQSSGGVFDMDMDDRAKQSYNGIYIYGVYIYILFSCAVCSVTTSQCFKSNRSLVTDF